jgi:murein DD-endopeptidase MepM/ murein hydrolase activator NlpD
MAKRIGFIFIAFLLLVLLDYAGTSIASSFSSFHSSGLFAPIAGPSTGLSSIDFDFFGKDGSGRNYITQGYGYTAYSHVYVNHWHNGIDIAAQFGAPIHSPGSAVVFAIGDQDLYCPGRGFGRYVAAIDVDHNRILWYAHLGKISVTPGQDIQKGAEIGTVGATGLETGAHLHFSVFDTAGFSMKDKYGCGPDADGKDLNPLTYLSDINSK